MQTFESVDDHFALEVLLDPAVNLGGLVKLEFVEKII